MGTSAPGGVDGCTPTCVKHRCNLVALVCRGVRRPENKGRTYFRCPNDDALPQHSWLPPRPDPPLLPAAGAAPATAAPGAPAVGTAACSASDRCPWLWATEWKWLHHSRRLNPRTQLSAKLPGLGKEAFSVQRGTALLGGLQAPASLVGAPGAGGGAGEARPSDAELEGEEASGAELMALLEWIRVRLGLACAQTTRCSACCPTFTQRTIRDPRP